MTLDYGYYPIEGVRPLDGSFIALNPVNCQWSKDRWQREFVFFKNLGMKTAVLNRAISKTNAYYQNCSLSGFNSTGNPIELIMSIADEMNLDIWLGLYESEEEWFTVNPTTLKDVLKKSVAVADDLHRIYQSHPSWKGWYIPEEIDNLNWISPDKQKKLIDKFLLPLTTHLNKLSPEKFILLSPSFNDRVRAPEEYGTWWNQVLAACPALSHLAVQDGIGVDHADWDTMPAYFHSLQIACQENHRTLWSDVELFNGVGFPEPASLGRITRQIKAVEPYVTGLLSWEFLDSLSPSAGWEQALRYSEYKDYLNGVHDTYLCNISRNKPKAQSGKPRPTTILDLGETFPHLASVWIYGPMGSSPAKVFVAQDNRKFKSLGITDEPRELIDGQGLCIIKSKGFAARYIKVETEVLPDNVIVFQDMDYND